MVMETAPFHYYRKSFTNFVRNIMLYQVHLTTGRYQTTKFTDGNY